MLQVPVSGSSGQPAPPAQRVGDEVPEPGSPALSQSALTEAVGLCAAQLGLVGGRGDLRK